MYSIKLELKLNNKERSLMAGCAGYARFVYNYGLNMVNGTKGMTKVTLAGKEDCRDAIYRVSTVNGY